MTNEEYNHLYCAYYFKLNETINWQRPKAQDKHGS